MKSLERVCLLASALAERMVSNGMAFGLELTLAHRWNGQSGLCTSCQGPHCQILGS